MTTQANQRQNIGCGDGTERWLFEEFNLTGAMLGYDVLGRAVVGYDCTVKFSGDDFGKRSFAITIKNPVVLEYRAWDNDGNDIRLNQMESQFFLGMILGAFSAVQCRVEEHELFLRGVIG